MAESGTSITPEPQDDLVSVIGRGVVSPVLHDPNRRKEMGLPEREDELGRYMIELNIQYRGGLKAASRAFEALCKDVLGPDYAETRQPVGISKSYVQILLSVNDWGKLLKKDNDQARDAATNQGRVGHNDQRVIYKLWPDFKVKVLIDRSVGTVKADAAFRSYSATGAGITWAVVDSGIDPTHLHFGSWEDPMSSTIYHPQVVELHRDFTPDAEVKFSDQGVDAPGASELDPVKREKHVKAILDDKLGHGTHVAGIIAGRLPSDAVQWPQVVGPSAPVSGPSPKAKAHQYAVFEQAFEADPEGQRKWTDKKPVARDVRRPDAMHGVAPECLLVSLKVIGKDGEGRVSDIMRALVYIREDLNDDPKMLRVHGVNLSVGYDFDAQMFACGQSPLCVEVDRLVKSGVVVVVAAGNTGYGNVSASQRSTMVGLSNTINDPGNAALAITVGSTHREAPHTYGVSFFSSKGPTGDGRLKPDLVAPGERITSCAAAAKKKELGILVDNGVAVYVDDSGTSMAAPHVSGAIAAFLSIRREFIQRPEEVKRIFLESATSLGRERYFEGHGLLDLMRAIQSV